MADLKDMSIEELELRIRIANLALKWLRSNDPMLMKEENRALVNPAIERVTQEARELTIACREKKMQRNQAEQEFVENIKIGLKPGRLNARRK